VVAVRSGKIADDDDEDTDEEEVHDDLNPFWLGVVEQPWRKAETASTIYGVRVLQGAFHMTLRYLDRIEAGEPQYQFADTYCCITANEILGILPVKKLGSYSLPTTENSHGKAAKKSGKTGRKRAPYKLNHGTEKQLSSLSSMAVL
jgi:hypothetical protein